MNKFIYIFFTLLAIFCANTFCYAQQDNLADTYLKDKTIEAPKPHTEYNYQDTDVVKVRLSITKDIKSESQVNEGDGVEFRVLDDVVYKDKIVVPEGTIVKAKVKTIITSGMNGIPASIIFGDFEIPNISPDQINYTYECFGQDRSLWVFPLKWALTILPPTGSLTNFIKGGHAKVETNDIITLCYHPNWY